MAECLLENFWWGRGVGWGGYPDGVDCPTPQLRRCCVSSVDVSVLDQLQSRDLRVFFLLGAPPRPRESYFCHPWACAGLMLQGPSLSLRLVFILPWRTSLRGGPAVVVSRCGTRTALRGFAFATGRKRAAAHSRVRRPVRPIPATW